jgi:hypothetical protein
MEDGKSRARDKARPGAVAVAAMLLAGSLMAQSQPPAAPAAVAQGDAKRPPADLNQLMRGIFFPQSNVVFLPQDADPAEIKASRTPSASTDPLTSVFGKWEAVENSALALAEAADLLMTPGRKCSNGRDVPLAKADWAQLVDKVREAGMVAYQAAKTKDRDKMTDAAEVLNASCAGCHGKYRPMNAANRCR